MLTEQETLDFCNKVREAGGADPIDAFFPSVIGDPNSCLIANGLNFDCYISPKNGTYSKAADYAEHWVMVIEANWLATGGENQAKVVGEKIAATTGLQILPPRFQSEPVWDNYECEYVEKDDIYNFYSDYDATEEDCVLALPKELAEVAIAFDNGDNNSWVSEYRS